jgi:RimJ/RimL family protein N-acetyltransferase
MGRKWIFFSFAKILYCMEIPELENEVVRLTPLSIENYHFIKDIAAEENLLQYSPSDISSPEKLRLYVEEALREAEKGLAIPYLIFDKRSQRYAGSTRFGLIDMKNKVLHIGWTWLGADFRGTGLNRHIKFLMLHHAFEAMGFEKVEFRIDERNMVSRRAIEKIGAKLEGVLRKNVYLPNGYKRNTCCYGLLKEEWEGLTKTHSAW